MCLFIFMGRMTTTQQSTQYRGGKTVISTHFFIAWFSTADPIETHSIPHSLSFFYKYISNCTYLHIHSYTHIRRHIWGTASAHTDRAAQTDLAAHTDSAAHTDRATHRPRAHWPHHSSFSSRARCTHVRTQHTTAQHMRAASAPPPVLSRVVECGKV